MTRDKVTLKYFSDFMPCYNFVMKKIIFASLYTLISILIVVSVIFGFMMGGGFQENIGWSVISVPIFVIVFITGVVASWRLAFTPYDSVSKMWKIFFFIPLFLVGIFFLVNYKEFIDF